MSCDYLCSVVLRHRALFGLQCVIMIMFTFLRFDCISHIKGTLKLFFFNTPIFYRRSNGFENITLHD